MKDFRLPTSNPPPELEVAKPSHLGVESAHLSAPRPIHTSSWVLARNPNRNTTLLAISACGFSSCAPSKAAAARAAWRSDLEHARSHDRVWRGNEGNYWTWSRPGGPCLRRPAASHWFSSTLTREQIEVCLRPTEKSMTWQVSATNS